MAVAIYEEVNYVENGDMFVCKLLTDQKIVMLYRCLYLDGEKENSDQLLVFNFENHYPKDNIFIPCGDPAVEKDNVIQEIKKRYSCETEIEFIKSENLLIKIRKK